MRDIAVRFGSVILALATAQLSCSSSETEPIEKATREQCVALREHQIDVRLSTVAGLDAAGLAGQRIAMRNAAGDGALATCQRELNATQVACLIAAATGDAMDACVAKVGAP
jgi:hypothetical protein